MAEQETRQIPISEAMRLGIEHHQAGRLPQAEVYYRAVLQAEPTHAGANYNLGLLALQTGRAQEAVPVLRAALQADPDNAAHWMNYAVALAGVGEPKQASEILLQARARSLGGDALASLLAQVERMIGAPRPAVVETVADGGAAGVQAINLSALLQLHEQGRHAEVEVQARALLERFASSAALARLLGSSLLAQNKYEQAREVLASAAETFPGDANIHDLHGMALRRLRRNDEARRAYELSLAITPASFETLLNASANAVSLGDAGEARRYAEQALALRPDNVDALRVLADAAAMGGSFEEAAALYRQGIAIDPNAVDLYINLGDALINLRRPDEATAEIEHALVLRPHYAPAHLSLGRALYQLGETASARRHFRAASDLAPDQPEAHTAYLFCLSHDDTVTPEESFSEHVRVAALIEAPVPHLRRPHENDRDPERGLRVGFVSADLRDHAVAYLIEPIWRAMRGGRHQVIAYVNTSAEDAVSSRLRALADAWVRVERMDDDTLAERIRADRIDILCDLSGHTVGNRLPVFARKPAPVQVSWIGYPGTTGMSSIDYRFIRGLNEQGGALDRLFSEKLVRFRHRGFEPEPGAPEVNPLPALGSGKLTFASFNRPGKINETTVELWSRVLLAVPGSRMLIAAIDEERTRQRLQALFAARGIAADRIEFRRRVPMAEYLSMHHEVDIVLDTVPYGGGTTTSHALWMGVPVLTLTGQSLQQSMTAAISGMVGLHDWAVHTPEAYAEKAKAAAANLAELDGLRQRLRPTMASAFRGSDDAVRIELDAAFQAIWRRWCAGHGPEGFTVSP